MGFGEFLVPTHPCLFMVAKEKIFTGTIRNSITNVMTIAKDTSFGTLRRWLIHLKGRPPMDPASHTRGRLKAIPNTVVAVPGLGRPRYAVARASTARLFGVIVVGNILT